MNKTKVGDMLIEMIEPKIREIEEKFSSGGALGQEDINTLLLKSQFNHINHLDLKLDEVVGSVVALEGCFSSFEQKVSSDFERLEKKVANDFERLEKKVANDFERLEKKVSNDIERLDHKITSHAESLELKFLAFEQKMESTIQKALNKNMMMLVIVMGAFLALFKVIDKF